jgi:hypothetical protein
MIRRMALFVVLGLASMLWGTVRAQEAHVRAEGSIDAVRLDVRDASLHEIFEVLSSTFGIRVHGSPALQQRVSGIYRGPLQQIVARLLAGHDYVTTYSKGSAEIRISDRSAEGKAQAALGRPPMPVTNPKSPTPGSAQVIQSLTPAPASAEVIQSLTPAPVSSDAGRAAGVAEKRSGSTLVPPASGGEDKALRLFVPR